MSDCSTNAWKHRRGFGDAEWHEPRASVRRPAGNPTAKLHVDFSDGKDWDYPIALNGREMKALSVELPEGHGRVNVSVGGVRHVPARKPDWDDCGVTD